MSRKAIITAAGHWNGERRELYWAEVLPGFAWWSASIERARIYDPASSALDDLQAAKESMLNPALAVVMVDPESRSPVDAELDADQRSEAAAMEDFARVDTFGGER